MAPAVTTTTASSTEHPALTHKLRKPLMEKLHEERESKAALSSSGLLSPEFLKQQPDSKLEKADILEMTVCFLTQQRNFLNNFNKLQSTSDENLRDADVSPLTSKDRRPANSALWRPWLTPRD